MRLSFTKILKFQKPKNKRGFTLLEMMVSLFLITVGVMGIFLVINRTLILMTPSPSKVIAAYLTQEGIEIVRNIRDGNWIEQQKTNPTPPFPGIAGCRRYRRALTIIIKLIMMIWVLPTITQAGLFNSMVHFIIMAEALIQNSIEESTLYNWIVIV